MAKSVRPPALRPELVDQVPRFMVLEREVEVEVRPRMLKELQKKVDAEADFVEAPVCRECGMAMKRHDAQRVGWTARFGRVTANVADIAKSRPDNPTHSGTVRERAYTSLTVGVLLCVVSLIVKLIF